MHGRSSTTGALAGALIVLGLLTGCTPPPTPPTSETATSSTPPSVTPEPTPDPSLDPEGTATDSLAYFDFVNRATIAETSTLTGRGMIDALVVAGFDKALMQVTPDTTVGGLVADSIQFSVRLGDECLIGQVGPASAYTSTVGGTVNGDSCLIGVTRPIDW